MERNNAWIRNLTKRLGDLPSVVITSFYSDTADLYETLGVQPGVDHFLNLGWWEDNIRDPTSVDEETITEACRELVRQLARFGDLQSEDRILDVGFGFAQQDLVLSREFDCENIIGINITPYQVRKGRQLIESNGHGDSVSLHVGDAVRLPYPDNQFDNVFALETAFHFHTRKDFFREANRVLREGGTIVTADIIDGSRRNSSKSLFSEYLANAHERYWNIPSENRIDTPGYRNLLESSGFTEIKIKNVSNNVLEPWTDYYLYWRLQQQSIPLRWFGTLFLKAIQTFYHDDYFRYIFSRATKEGD